ncbi:RNA-directed DNA polymerase from mobile element jockey [Trichonephila clavipes]|nr:RNA-directed DNA polymerase from mobile element jockey [Trichonephila clavipes]
MLLASIGMNHLCVCRAWRPVSLERRVLVIEGSQHIALASASGKREKGLSATVGSVKAVSKMRSGDLLVEISTTKQAEQLLALQMLANIPITVLPHANLNSSRGVISESDLYNVPEQEILEGLQDQKVCAVRRITIRRDGQVVNTKHLILTFACPDLPQFITAGYLRCSVRPYIPNPLRCFQCQRFGHSKPTCRGKPTCARCGAVGHDSGELKIKNRLTYPEARLAVSNRTPIQGLSYAAVAKKVTTSSGTQTSPVTIIDNSKEKAPEQPSQKHSPRKDNKKIIVKPKTTLKKKPGKNVSLKIAREANSLYESTPVSKRSRRRKTSQTSDAMDTDVNPSDTDYVIGQASEEDESLLEANFKQATSNPLTGTLLPLSPKDNFPALQETFLKSCHTAKIRRYGCVRKDTEGSSVSGGVCIFTSLDIPSSALSLHTSLQAVAVRIHSTSLFTVCCLYLPPNVVIRQQDLNDLVDQLPAPFVILGDFNGHSTLWGSVKTNHRGRQIEQVLSDHCLCLLNHEEPTHFHEPTRSFHTLDLAICSPSLLPILNFSVEKDLYNSDHFPVVLSHDYDAGGKTFPPRYSYSRAEWALFTQLAVISDAMVKTESVDTAVQDVTNVLIDAADLSIPKSSSHSFQRYKPWWNADCQTAYKNQRKLWGTFRRYPTTENLIAFKRAKALARRIRRQCQRESWIKYVSSITSSSYQPTVMEEDVANVIGKTFASVSSSDSYSPAFQATKNRLERTPINFRCRQPLLYNCDIDMFELKRALSSAHNTSPGPDGISYELLRHLNEDSLASLYVDDLQISCEGSDMRMIERQLQTAVNNILKWCDTNGHSISASKSCCVHFCRKRGIHPDPEIRIRDIQIPCCQTPLGGADRTSLLRVYQAIVLSRIDYGCVAYGSACNSTLQKLDPVHHMALRICSGAFRTSPVQSLYVNCHQLPLDLRRRKLSLAFYFKILSVPSHPLQNVYMSTSMKRLYDARPSNIRPFMDRMKLHISELDLPNVHIQQRNLFLFQPLNTPRFHYINPFATYSKSTVAPVVFQRVFAYHRSQYSRYSAIYTDGSKRADYVGCGVVIEDIMHGYRLDTSCSIFTAEAVAIYRALQLIDSTMPRKYCIYTDSMVYSKRLKTTTIAAIQWYVRYSKLRVDCTARVSISCFAGCQVT